MINKISKTKTVILILVVCSILLGGVQEKLKIHINSNIELSDCVPGYDLCSALERKRKIEQIKSEVKHSYYSSHQKLDILYEFEKRELYGIKWLLVPVFLSVNFFINLALVVVLGVNRGRLFWVYLVVLVAVTLVYGLGRVVQMDFFPFVRRGVLFLETMIPVVLLYFSQIILDQKNEDKQ